MRSMKKIVSTLILLIMLFLIFEFGINYFKKGHEISYQVFFEDKAFNVVESYQKENSDNYFIKIEYDNNQYYYVLDNYFNKQREIINGIEFFTKDDINCIYPILENGNGTYLQCTRDGKNYSALALNDQTFISRIKTLLEDKGYTFYKKQDLDKKEQLGNSTVYVNNLLENDYVTLWSYKNVDVLSNNKLNRYGVLNFDKYENNHGYLVGNYYVVPKYLSNRVLEFSSVNIINVIDGKYESVELGHTLSSNTYINGVVDGKLYYTDPSNLIQLELNPVSKKTRLIGSKDIGGQIYDNGKWTDRNIYDFVGNKLLFKGDLSEVSNYSYVEMIETDSCYYYYNNSGEVYQLSKFFMEKPILLFKNSDINNFTVVDDTIYYVTGDSLYYYSDLDGSVILLKNNELRYNKTNRIDVYRKS